MEYPAELFKPTSNDKAHCIPYSVREFEHRLIACGFARKDAQLILSAMKQAYALCKNEL
ncbi:MAG: hypothetical protein WAW61_17635 [Methylococcaceae bacterium]